MRTTLRIAAVAIAIAGFVDPAIARRVRAPLSVQFRLPAASHPDFSRAEALRAELATAIREIASVDGASAPHAIVAIGDAQIGALERARVFSVALPDPRPWASITAISVPRRTVLGQTAIITAVTRGVGLAGRASTATLELRGAAPIGTISHTWTKDEESFDARFSFAPPGPGVHRVRINVSTAGVAGAAAADAVVVVGAEPLRILVFESRPSWPVTFVRRSLEGDALFDVASSVRSSRPVVTLSSGAPASLRALDVDRYDVLVIGSLDELQTSDLDVLDRFVMERGGTLILLPDRQVSRSVRDRFDLPALDEALLEKPVDVKAAPGGLKASELLVPPTADAGVQPLASVQHGNGYRPLVFALDRGAGRIVFSGALDAWRYRAATFDAFWRSLVADAALAAPPKLDVAVEPAVARPGDMVKLTVDVRATEIEQDLSARRVPPITAMLTSESGSDEPIRLWPSTRAGTFDARLHAPAEGRYTVTASAGGTSSSVPLLIAKDVIHARRGIDRAAAYAARATGGAVLDDPGELVLALSTIDAGTEERTSHPMRSPWWIAPFSLILCAEWALRRRSGLK